MNIYLIRHGQTELNQSNTHQYSSTPLSERGIKEAVRLAKRLKEAEIDIVYSSPLERAKQTAEVISEISQKSLLFLDELREIKRPTEIEGKTHDDVSVKKIKEMIKQNSANKLWHYSDEENFWDVKARIQNLMRRLEEENVENILLVSHGMVIKMFLALSIFKDDMGTDEFFAFYNNVDVSNTGICHCHYTPKLGWKVVRVNDTVHLTDSM